MPKALRDFKGYSIYFWSNESSGSGLEPIHVHVSKGKPSSNATKIWITPAGLQVCHNGSGIPDSDLHDILKYIALNRDSIIGKWYSTFSQL